jgi:putative transposase
MGGQIKALTIPRERVGRLWLGCSVLEKIVIPETSPGQSGAFDGGLKDCLVDDQPRRHPSPPCYPPSLHLRRQLNRELSRQVEGASPDQRARRALARQQAQLANQRRASHFKRAHEGCDGREGFSCEALNLAGRQASWGRPVSDRGFAPFLSSLEWLAFNRGNTVLKIARLTPTTQVCSACGHHHDLTLPDRPLTCDCGLSVDRDHNAAMHLRRLGPSMLKQSANKPKVRLRRRVEGRSPRL